MTEGQWCSFWRLWGAACVGQGWDKLTAAERDGKRRETLLQLGFNSAKEIDKTAGFDRVKRRLEELAHVLPAPVDGEKVRLLHRIGEVIAGLEESLFPGHRLAAILKSNGVVTGVRALEDLEKERLLSLSAALAGILKDWEAEKDEVDGMTLAEPF
jgi:hypothetical protein